jgi:CIC family chloride channel protein
MDFSKLYRDAISLFNIREQPFAIYILIGVLCGLATVAFNLGIHFVFDLIVDLQKEQPVWLMAVLMILSPALGGLIVGLVLTYVEPSAGGSGIPQAKQAYWNKHGILTLKETLWRFLLGIVSIGSGNSLGSQGPTVHLSAGIASVLGQFIKLDYKNLKNLVPVGISAGIASAFNAPMAAIMFVIEELLLNEYKPKQMAGIVFAAVIAASVERTLLGSSPVYDLSHMPAFDVDWWMLVCIPIGIIGGISGSLFLRSLLKARQFFFYEQKVLPKWLRPAVGGFSMGIVGTAIFFMTDHHGIFGLGFDDLNGTLNGNIVGFTLLVLFIGKLIATVLSFSTGGSGGLFAPSLFAGTMMGGFIGYLVSEWLLLDPVIIGGSALLGMGAFFAGFMRLPLTSVLIIYEMTGNYSLILPLMFGNMIAFSISERLHKNRIYDSLLLQDGIQLSCDVDKFKGNSQPQHAETSLNIKENKGFKGSE